MQNIQDGPAPQTTVLEVEIVNNDTLANEKPDIEHAEVTDDPRQWSLARKSVILVTVSGAAIVLGLGANLYNPAIAQIESDLHASSGSISWSISLFILVQGSFPLVWSAISEIYGRKTVYIISFAIGVAGCIITAHAQSIGVLIGMRVLQAIGSSSVFSMGAATLSDIYDSHVRGTMMGILYSAPLLGPALGPMIGGALTQAFSWRATFWFIAAFQAVFLLAFLFTKDTFRRERSLTYQTALKRRLKTHSQPFIPPVVNNEVPVDEEARHTEHTGSATGSTSDRRFSGTIASSLNPPKTSQNHEGTTEAIAGTKEVRLTFRDISPTGPIIAILSKRNNLVILCSSGLIFAFGYCLAYTCSRTLSSEYGYDALQIGVVLLAFGIGSVSGSVLGGRWSDYVLARLKAKNKGIGTPEMRLQSTFMWMAFLPVSSIAFGWLVDKHVHISAVCVFLFCSGFFSIAIYASTLAYIVDANVGRSSIAVATNASIRGFAAFVATEVAVPLQLSIGDGGLYTVWAGLMLCSEILILLVWWKGDAWRRQAECKEAKCTERV